MRRRQSAHRRDDNHAAVKQALEANGWYVADTSQVGKGFPDLVALKCGQVEFIEVKDGSKRPSERKLSPQEELMAMRFHAAGKRILVIETVDQAVSL